MLNMLQSLVVIVNVGVVPLSAGGLIWMTISERDTSRLNMAYLFNHRNDDRHSFSSHYDKANTSNQTVTLGVSQGETGVAREQISVSDGDRSSRFPEGPSGGYDRTHFLLFVRKQATSFIRDPSYFCPVCDISAFCRLAATRLFAVTT